MGLNTENKAELRTKGQVILDVLNRGSQCVALNKGGGERKRQLTLKAGFAPSSSRHLTANRHRLDAAMCRAVPKSKSLQVASTSARRRGKKKKKDG